MNKKEILEIRKQFTPANCAITRICGCYVDHEKTKKMESKEAFLSLLKKKHLNISIFSKRRCQALSERICSIWNSRWMRRCRRDAGILLKLRDSKLEDDMLLEEFYDKVSLHMIMRRIIISS